MGGDVMIYYVICRLFGTHREIYGWTRNEHIVKSVHYINSDAMEVETIQYDCSFEEFLYIMENDWGIYPNEIHKRELKIAHTKSGKTALLSEYWFEVIFSDTEAVYSELEDACYAYHVIKSLKPYLKNKDVAIFMDFLAINYLREFARNYKDSYFHGSSTDILGLLLEGGYMIQL